MRNKEHTKRYAEANELYEVFKAHLVQDRQVREAIIQGYWSGHPQTEIFFKTDSHSVWLNNWDNLAYGIGSSKGLEARLHPLDGKVPHSREEWNINMGINIPFGDQPAWFHYYNKTAEQFQKTRSIDTNPITARLGIEQTYQLLTGRPFPKKNHTNR